MEFETSDIQIRKSKRYFRGTNTPILEIPDQEYLYTTVINLGNLHAESALAQNPVLVAIGVVVCSGTTTWLLELISAKWTWNKVVAIPILHFCLVVMLTLPLWYGRQINHPGSNLTVARWDALYSITLYQHTNSQRSRTTLNLLQVCRKKQRDQ